MKILMCNLLLLTLMVFLKSTESAYQRVQAGVVTFVHEYRLPLGTPIYSYKNQHYIRDVRNNNPQTIVVGDRILRNKRFVGSAERDEHGTNFYDLRHADKPIREQYRLQLKSQDTVVRGEKSLIAVYIDPIGFQPLHELRAGSSPTAYLRFAIDPAYPYPVQFETKRVGYEYFFHVPRTVYSYNNRHYILHEDYHDKQIRFIMNGDEIVRDNVIIAIAERRTQGVQFYDLDDSGRPGNERTIIKPQDTLLRDSNLVAVYIADDGFRALREVTPESS